MAGSNKKNEWVEKSQQIEDDETHEERGDHLQSCIIIFPNLERWACMSLHLNQRHDSQYSKPTDHKQHAESTMKARP